MNKADGWMGGWINGQMDGWMNARMDGWMEGYGWIDKCMTKQMLDRKEQEPWRKTLHPYPREL